MYINYINHALQQVPTICINLKIRHDKRKWMKNQCKRRKIKFKFFIAHLHKNPKRGCLESHLSIIKEAIARGDKHLLILEDDAKFLKPLNNIPLPPDDWDMLYLGGTVKNIYEKEDGNPWVKMACWTTHAYIVNLQNQELVQALLVADSFPGEIDSYYIKFIHSRFNAYMVNPMIAIQQEGYSDIEKTNVNYDFMQDTLKGLRKPRHDIVNGQYSLKLPPIPMEDLPQVTIVTPTFERRHLFSIAIWNFNGFYYPKNKLEWVIIDDSVNEMKSVEDMLPHNDPRIKYYHFKVDKPMTIAKKRNLGAERASHDIIIHMDDDDFYPGESVLARVKVLLKYQEDGIECVGCSKIGVYDLLHNASSISTDGELSLSEASMAYFKKFWEARPFNDIIEKGEYRTFIHDRFDKIMDIPYSFVIIAFSHNANFTEKKREITHNQLVQQSNSNDSTDILSSGYIEAKEANFIDTWPPETQLFVRDIANYLKKHIEKQQTRLADTETE